MKKIFDFFGFIFELFLVGKVPNLAATAFWIIRAERLDSVFRSGKPLLKNGFL